MRAHRRVLERLIAVRMPQDFLDLFAIVIFKIRDLGFGRVQRFALRPYRIKDFRTNADLLCFVLNFFLISARALAPSSPCP